MSRIPVRYSLSVVFLSLIVLAAGCRSESRIIHGDAILLEPEEWTGVPIESPARGDVSQACVTLPTGYRYRGATGQAAIVTDNSTHRQLRMSARFIDNERSVRNVSNFGSGGPYARTDGRSVCFALPSRARGVYSTIQLTASDTLTVDAISWDTYYLTVLF